ncbi:MAG: hypothetical protein Q9220_003136 [cf. Caloplaca sp. 1 TL-2023]
MDKKDAVPGLGDFPIDDGILAKFPPGTQVISANHYGISQWTVTAQVDVTFPDGQTNRYFLKTAKGEVGRRLMEGEFHAISALHNADNAFAPKPHSWGKQSGPGPDTYFFLLQFIDIDGCLPDPDRLCEKLAQLHRNSISPTGKFGFHINTCQGKTQQSLEWESSWPILFAKMLKHVAREDTKTNGQWDALDRLESRVLSHVVPRLLGALESDGRSIKPCLIHGDLWEGNTGTTPDRKNIYIFDAASFYAHNEMEIGMWRCFYNQINRKEYTDTYLKYFPEDEPKEEWDDRNRMYSIYYNILYSVNHGSAGTAIRQLAFDDMYYLVAKFAPFPVGEGPPRIHPSERAVFPTEAEHMATKLAYAAKLREGVGS